MIKMSLEFGEVKKALDNLAGPGKESLGRRMSLAATRVIRDEAILRVPVGKEEAKAHAQFGGSWSPGLLKSAIYNAFNQKASTASEFTYSVSWNHKRAPHGHLVEFGHWRPYAIIFIKGVGWRTDKDRPLPGNGKWVRSHSFIGAAYDATKARAGQAAIEAGRREAPKILRGDTNET